MSWRGSVFICPLGVSIHASSTHRLRRRHHRPAVHREGRGIRDQSQQLPARYPGHREGRVPRGRLSAAHHRRRRPTGHSVHHQLGRPAAGAGPTTPGPGTVRTTHQGGQGPRVPRSTPPLVRSEPNLDARRIPRRSTVHLVPAAGCGPGATRRGEENGDGHATIRPPDQEPGGEEGQDGGTVMVVAVGPGVLAGPRAVHCGDRRPPRQAGASASRRQRPARLSCWPSHWRGYGP